MISSALVLLGAAILVATLFHSMKLPPIVAFIVAGIIVGPFGFALVGSMPQVGVLAEVAAVLLMFTIGLEFSLKELSHFRRPILILGLSQILITIIVFSLIFWLGFSMIIEKAIFLSLLIAPSSTAVVLKLLYDNRDFESPYGKAAFSILLLQDIAVIAMIVAVPFLVSHGRSSDSFLDSILPLLLLAGLSIIILYLLSKYILPFVLHRVSQTRNREIFFFTVLFICIGAATLMHKVGLSVSLGAFVAGMLLAGSHYGKQATAEILPLRDSFLCLFFVTIGMMLDLNFLFGHFAQIFFLGLGVVFLKSIILFTIIWLTGNSGSVSRAVTALLFQFGEFSFIIAELGVKNKLLGEKEYQFFVAIAITSLALTPILYAKVPRLLHSQKFDHILPEWFISKAKKFRASIQKNISRPMVLDDMETTKPLEDHVVVIGYGIAGQSLCRVLQHLKIPVQVIEMNAETVRIHADKIPITYGDAANLQILKKVGVERARLVAIVTSGVNMLEPILNAVHELNPNISVLARTNYLLDLSRLKKSENIRFVISELESTLEVISETLNEFKVEGQIVHQVVSDLRVELRGSPV